MLDCGSFVISLDYELMWGMIDVASKDGYGLSNVKNVPIVIDRLLDLFEKYKVSATVAVVGMSMYNDKNELLEDIPDIHPSYENSISSPYENGYINQIKQNEECLFFHPEIISKLKESILIEIGTHTYCHYYCWEKGQTIEQFRADLVKFLTLAEQKNIHVTSIVFPRNQVPDHYLSVCSENGITSYRGNSKKYFNQTNSKIKTLKNRILRTLDTYINIGGMTTVPYSEITKEGNVMNIRASRILKPYSEKISFLEEFRLRRICNEMIYAAKHKEMYHLWWHPHNMGADVDGNMKFLERILKCYKMCNERFGMKSFTMNGIYNNLKQI